MASYQELTNMLVAVCRAARHGPLAEDSVLLKRAVALIQRAREGRKSEVAWTSFLRARAVMPSAAQIAAAAKSYGTSEDHVRATLAEETGPDVKIWVNSRYQVLERASADGAMVYLSIKRLDQEPIRSWRDLQRIKTELVGAECEGVEIFPAESRLVDTANQYHLWVFTDPSQSLPFGMAGGRHVADNMNAGEGQEPLAGD